MKYILIGNERKGVFETSTQKLLQTLNAPLEEKILLAPDSMQYGLFPSLAYRKRWVMTWVDLFEDTTEQGLTPVFIEQDSYISCVLALKAFKEEEEFEEERAAILEKFDDLDRFGEHIHLCALLMQYKYQLQNSFKKSWKGFRSTVCGSSFSLLMRTQNGAKNCCAAQNLLDLAEIEIVAKDQLFETVPYIATFNPKVALKENARVYYEMFDKGIDFVTVLSWNAFKFYENECSRVTAAAGREVLDAPLLHLSEIFLLALGEQVPPHKIPLGML